MLVYKLAKFYRSHFKIILVLSFLALALLAWSNRFIQDDAFISFRYADNFIHGKGLVWNEGERVEGYTNFLWTLIISVPIFLNLDPTRFSFAIGILLFALSLYFTYRLAATLLQSNHLALLTVIFLGTNHTFSSYATGGMETQLQTCLFVACMFLLSDSVASRRWSRMRLCLLSVLLGLAVLTRPDSVLLVSVALPVMLFHIRRAEGERQKSLLSVCVLGPLVVLVGGWLFWKLRLYGSVLPNTFYVKVASLNSLKRGMFYVYLFFQSYWLMLFPFLFLIFSRRLFHEKNRQWIVLSMLVALWLLYVVFVGGDFMEFRFIVPILPFIFMHIAWLIFVPLRRLKLQIVLVVLVLAGALHHALTFTNPSLRYYDIESTRGLSDLLTQESTDWIGIGKVLGESFNHDANVSIATTAAGAIPYYSRMKAIDILGLNDKWVARHGEIVAAKPGHQRRAPLSYLIERKVNLLIGHPQMVSTASDGPAEPLSENYFYTRITPRDVLPQNARILEIPINQGYKLRLLYLTESPLVDETIKRKGWKTYPFVRSD